MTRILFSLTALLLAAGAAVAADGTSGDFLKQRLNQVNAEIDTLRGQIEAEVSAAERELKGLPVDWERIRGALGNHVGMDEVKKALGEATDSAGGGVPLFAKELRDKAAALRQPLDVLDSQINSNQAEIDRLKGLGGAWDFGGWKHVYGAYSDEIKALRQKNDLLARDRADKLKQIDAAVAADEDLKRYKTLEGLETGATKAYKKFYDQAFGHAESGPRSGMIDWMFYSKPTGDAQTRAVRIKQLLAELALLVAERERLLASIHTLHNQFVAWSNEVGWLYVGSFDDFERQKYRSKGSETWGGLSADPLKSDLRLGGRKFDTFDKAMEAVAASLSDVKLRRAPLAFPKQYYTGNLDGADLMLKSMLLSHPAMKEKLPTE